MALLPPVLGPDDLPLAERMAAGLDGELFPLAAAHCPVDAVETPALRLAAALTGRSPRFIAELGTAAWVWGATTLAPGTLELCVELGARARPPRAQQVSMREVLLGPGDVRVLDGWRVTSPLRTAVDLARARPRFGHEESTMVRALGAIGGFDVAECLAAMETRRNLPGKRRAAERLLASLGWPATSVRQPALTR
jgi:hypothetical protein